MEIKMIGPGNKNDINIPNEPFPLMGRMKVSFAEGKWEYGFEYFSGGDVGEMTFPDENYDYSEMAKDCFFVGAYENGECVGLAIYKNDMFNYLYLSDLKVNRAYRGKGVGAQLIRKGMELAGENGYIGVYAIAQDDNVCACRFYLKNGFEIGGFNGRVYDGTSQEGKGDVYFYKGLKTDG